METDTLMINNVIAIDVCHQLFNKLSCKIMIYKNKAKGSLFNCFVFWKHLQRTYELKEYKKIKHLSNDIKSTLK